MTDAPIAHYAFRRSVLEQDKSYSLYTDRLVVDGIPYPLSEIRKVHLKYEHSKQRGYYQCHIHTMRGRIDLRHVHWQSFGSFEDRRASYTPFVKALIAEAAKMPGVEFRAGSLVNFIAAIVGVPLMAGLAWLCVSMGRYAMATLATFFGGLSLIMIEPSRPYRFDPLTPPPSLLPEIKG